jgi:L-arabinose isomerase
MSNDQTPRIGFLGIMQELYDNDYPDITERQEAYAREVMAAVGDEVEFVFPGAARNRADIEARVRQFNRDGLDGILIVMLTYGPALRTVRAFRENALPVMLANIQPLPTVTDDWDMSHLTFNQGVHGAQDTANALLRIGYRLPVISEDWRSRRFRDFVVDFARAARALQELRSLKVATFGQMQGMGDILTDNHAFMRVLGPEVQHHPMGALHAEMEAVDEAAVEAVMAENAKNFEIDPDLPEANHRYAAKLQAAITRFLEGGEYGAWSIYFDQIGMDGRFRQIHMLAASNLMAKGYGYAAEGDTCTASLVAAGHRIAPDAHFTEMYAMDFERDSALQSHMGEGNWRIARRNRKPRLIDRYLGIGGLDNPPTVLFQAQPGPATLVSLVALEGEHYRLVVAQGEILDTGEMPNVEMPYFHFRPESGVRDCLDGWLRAGGTHHQVLHLGDVRERWRLFAELTGVDCVEV